MTIAATLGDALEFEGIDYRILRTPARAETTEALRACGVVPEQRAKALLLKDAQGFLLTVTSITRVPDIERLRRELHRDLVLAEDEDLDELFCDCEAGSVPPIGPWYRIPTVVDPSLREPTEVVFDAGEPRSLVQVEQRDFAKLLDGAEYLAFSSRDRS